MTYRNYTRRQLLALILGASFMVVSSGNAFGWSRTEHDAMLERALLGGGGKKGLSQEQEAALTAIENAAYLCIDQFKGDGEKYLNELKGYKRIGFFGGIRDLPKDISEIDIPTVIKHRSYSHRGWDYTYTKSNKAKWEKRKAILLNTVTCVFDFENNGDEYDAKCDSFCALTYYIHLLGDCLQDSDWGKLVNNSNGLKMRFADPNAGRTSNTSYQDIPSEIDKHLKILFKDTKKKSDLRSLCRDINKTADDSRKLVKNSQGTDEDYEKLHGYVQQLVALLGANNPQKVNAYGNYEQCNKISKLLSGEDFFSKVF